MAKQAEVGMSKEIKLKSTAIELFCLSLAALFFELLVIRWLTCSFPAFGVFKTFPLVTCFVGLGIGVSKADNRLFRYTPLALILFVATVQGMSALGFGNMHFPSTGLYQWSDFSSAYASKLGLYILGMAQAIVLLLSGPLAVMICLGARIGVLFNLQKPLHAYCIDIGGAITGGLVFGLLSFWLWSPNVQLGLLCIPVLYYLWPQSKPAWSAAAGLGLAAVLAILPVSADARACWTPYYRIDQSEINLPAAYSASGKPEVLGIYVGVNKGFSQIFTKTNNLDLAAATNIPKSVQDLKYFLDVRKAYYGLPYTFKQPKDVLILGAGTGSDVKEAISTGAQTVDAIEIDPVILRLGRKYNKTYASDRVHIICDDGRNFLNSCKKKYDMVIYACLDSSAVNGVGSSIRTDSYIHTVDSYRKAISLLKPDGIFVLSFGASTSGNSDWLRNRIYKTISEAAGYPPVVISDQEAPVNWPAYVFVTGEPVRRKELPLPENKQSFTAVRMPESVQEKLLTDDWPYLYVKSIAFDIPYLAVLLEIILITIYASRHLLFRPKSGTDMQLFFLGAGFILLELQSISRLSLLYGTTWLTSLIVINGVLFLILLANFTVLRLGIAVNQSWLYAGLAAALLVSYLLPIENVLQLDSVAPYLGHISVTILTLLPIFMASLIFANAFIGVSVPATSFAFNLLGTVLGALLEYLSIYWGINAMVLLALLLYFFSYFGSEAQKKYRGPASITP